MKEEVLKFIETTGSTWMPVSQTVDASDDDLVCREWNGQRYITHRWYHNCEKHLAALLNNRIRSYEVDNDAIHHLIQKFQKKYNLQFAEEQIRCIKMILENHFCILTGGAGTGKTSVIKCAVYVIRNLYPKSSLSFCAPTGKAAKRMTESIGVPAYTILKKMNLENGFPTKIVDDFFFIDEASMIDFETFYNLIKNVSSVTRIILIGDINQLPSVSEGAVLRDLIDSNIFPITQLEKTYRQDEDSSLFENIQTVLKGGYIPLKEGPDFKRIVTEENVFNICVQRYLENIQIYGKDQTVILTPYRKAGKVCANTLNYYLQSKVNPNGKEYSATIIKDDKEQVVRFRVGDPVMHLRNWDNISNGDTGKVIEVTKGYVKVRYHKETICYSKEDLEDLELAYAISITKSQGSEYACAIIPVLQENKNLDQNMIYTAITRAKKLCEVVGLDETIEAVCKIHSAWKRNTFLCEELQIVNKASAMLAQII